MVRIDTSTPTKKNLTDKGFAFNYVVDNGVCFLCVSEESFPRRLCFACLERLRSEHAIHGSLTNAFINAEMAFFSTNPEADKIRRIQAQVDDVKEIMLDNLDSLLNRGEKLEDIDAMTDDLHSAPEFKRQSNKLKCALVQANMKMSIVIVAIIIFFV